jgi:excisionase family DNA binding protein
MTVSEAAKRIGVSASKLYQLVAARKIAHYRIGGKIVFGEDDLAAFLAVCHVDAATAAPARALPPAPRLKHLSLH